MIDEKKEWGEFSDWLHKINENIGKKLSENEDSEPEKLCEDISLSVILDTFKRWMKYLEDAPVTTWKEELSVRGYDFVVRDKDPDSVYTANLWKLLQALAGMRVFVVNTDHLCDRALYRILVEQYIVKQVAQIPFDNQAGCVIDIVGSEVQEDPASWLRFYASSRERMEWAKQNIGKILPPSEHLPYCREDQLPKP